MPRKKAPNQKKYDTAEKAVRINFPVDSDNYNFMRTMAGITKQSMSSFLNMLIRDYAQRHASEYRQAQRLADKLLQDIQDTAGSTGTSTGTSTTETAGTTPTQADQKGGEE